jgi:hypothetical protein
MRVHEFCSQSRRMSADVLPVGRSMTYQGYGDTYIGFDEGEVMVEALVADPLRIEPDDPFGTNFSRALDLPVRGYPTVPPVPVAAGAWLPLSYSGFSADVADSRNALCNALKLCS